MGNPYYSQQHLFKVYDGYPLLFPTAPDEGTCWEILTFPNSTCSRFKMGIPYFSQQHLIKAHDVKYLLFPSAPDQGTCWEVLTIPNSNPT